MDGRGRGELGALGARGVESGGTGPSIFFCVRLGLTQYTGSLGGEGREATDACAACAIDGGGGNGHPKGEAKEGTEELSGSNSSRSIRTQFICHKKKPKDF